MHWQKRAVTKQLLTHLPVADQTLSRMLRIDSKKSRVDCRLVDMRSQIALYPLPELTHGLKASHRRHRTGSDSMRISTGHISRACIDKLIFGCRGSIQARFAALDRPEPPFRAFQSESPSFRKSHPLSLSSLLRLARPSLPPLASGRNGEQYRKRSASLVRWAIDVAVCCVVCFVNGTMPVPVGYRISQSRVFVRIFFVGRERSGLGV